MLKYYLLYVLCCITTVIANAQQSVGYGDQRWKPSGPVKVAVKAGNIIYIAGDFTSINPPNPYGAAVNTVDGSPLLNYVSPNATILTTIPDGLGGWYIGGAFTEVGGQPRNHLARINNDGSLNAWNPGANDTVRALLQDGNLLYIGGSFTIAGGQSRNYLAAFDVSTGAVTSWNPSANARVFCLATDGITVYAGGKFSMIGGANRANVAAINSAGVATAWNPGVAGTNSHVRALAIAGDTVFIGGYFTSAGGQSRTNLASVNKTTSVVTSWNPVPNSGVHVFLKDGNTLYTGGAFSFIGSSNRFSIGSFNIATGALDTWNPDLGYFVDGIAKGGNVVYAAGGFSTAGSGLSVVTRNAVAAIDATTGIATTWKANANNDAHALGIQGNTLYIGGSFTTVGRVNRNRIAAIDATTGAPTAFNPNANSGVYALALHNGILYAGGYFTNIGGQARSRLAALDTATSLATTWNPNANSYVLTLAGNGNTMYAGGGFATVGGQSRNRLAAIDLTTGIPSAWNPSPNADINTLTIGNGLLYAGGEFSTISTESRNAIAVFDTGTGNLTTWNANVNSGGSVNAISATAGKLYVGGAFTSIGGLGRNNIAELNATTALATAWNPNSSGEILGLAVNGNTIYAGGFFTSIGGQSRNNIAALDGSTGNATSWNPKANTQVVCLIPAGSTVYAGGNYYSMNNSNLRYYFMALTDSNQIVVALPVAPVITGVSATELCAGANIQITFTGASMNAGNVYIAELSNGSGSFSSSKILGSLSSTNGGVINGIIPATMSAGTKYRVRVSSSSPGFISNKNDSNIVIHARPATAAVTITASGPLSFCAGDQVTLSVPASAGYSYQWNNGGVPIPGATAPSYGANATGAHSVTVASNFGCARVSSSKTIKANPYPVGTFSKMPKPDGTVKLTATQTSSSYQWYLNSGAIAGATARQYTATATGIYHVTVTKTNCTTIGDTSTVVTTNTARISIGEAPSASLELIAYPNPASSDAQLQIAYQSNETSVDIVIRDLIGRTVSAFHDVPKDDILRFGSELPPGMYIIEAKTVDGQQAILKWVKK